MRPGPAFIQLPRRWKTGRWSLNKYNWAKEHVPFGYKFQSATIGTAAGWVRPHGSGLAEAAQTSYIICADDEN